MLFLRIRQAEVALADGRLDEALSDYNTSIAICPWSVDPVLNRVSGGQDWQTGKCGRSTRHNAASDAAFNRAGADPEIVRGIYRLQYGLSQAELDRSPTAPERWNKKA